MPGDNKAVTRTIAVIVLVLLAIVALRGYLPGRTAARRSPPQPTPTAPAQLLAVLVMLAVSLTAIAVSLVTQARRPLAGPQPSSHRANTAASAPACRGGCC